MLADPGVGKAGAPIGTVEWAQYVRLTSQPVIDDARKAPREAYELVLFIIEHRAWSLMNKPDGSCFTKFEDFCEHPKPYGWGTRWDELRPILEGVAGRKAIALGTVPEAEKPPVPSPGPGRGKRKLSEDNSDGFIDHAAEREIGALRAIDRSPKPAQDLWKRDLMSKGVAIALGTTARDTKPEKAAAIAEATAAAVAVVEGKKPSTPAEKRKVRREVDAVVRAKLGKPTPTAIDRVLAALRALQREELQRLRDEIDRLLSEAA